MEEGTTVGYKKYESFLHIFLSNEKQRNCLSPVMMQQVLHAIENNLCKNCRFVILTAVGEHFCAGADLNWMKKQKDSSLIENYRDSDILRSFFDRLYKVEVPIFSYVQGGSYGGGVGLVAISDYVIAESKASFCLSEVKLGLVPAVISPYVVSKIGISWFTALSTSARVVTAQEALGFGLVHEIASDELTGKSTQDKVLLIAKRYGKLSPQALKENKKIIRSYSDKIVGTSHDQFFNRATITKLRASSEGQEGMSSLLEKRAPSWDLEVK